MSIKRSVRSQVQTGVGNNYTYPQFVIDEKTGQVDVNFIDRVSGRVVRHIPASELNNIVRNQDAKSK